MRRPAARLSELAFTAVAACMLTWLGMTLWPTPELDVSPAWCRPKYTQWGDGPTRGLPPSYQRYVR